MTFNLSTFQIYNIMATHTNQEQMIAPSNSEIILYQTVDGRTNIDVKLENETVWLTQAQMDYYLIKTRELSANTLQISLKREN